LKKQKLFTLTQFKKTQAQEVVSSSNKRDDYYWDTFILFEVSNISEVVDAVAKNGPSPKSNCEKRLSWSESLLHILIIIVLRF
jgi:hypothetical protein